MTNTATTINTYATANARAHNTPAALTILLVVLCRSKVSPTAGQVLFTFRSGVHPPSHADVSPMSALLRDRASLLLNWLFGGLVYSRASQAYLCSPYAVLSWSLLYFGPGIAYFSPGRPGSGLFQDRSGLLFSRPRRFPPASAMRWAGPVYCSGVCSDVRSIPEEAESNYIWLRR